MAEITNIEWADATVNFWWGCTKVSPGCANCYAETLSHRFGDDIWGKGKPRRKIKGAVSLARKLERQAIKEGRRLRVFCSSMADWLDPEVPVEWLIEMLDTIRQTPHLDWMLLTKRPELWEERMLRDVVRLCGRRLTNNPLSEAGHYAHQWLRGHAPANVWIGTSVEDQKRADERIPVLLEIPAKVRFLSCEPLLGPVDISHVREGDNQWFPLQYIHWIIVGGESGTGARPMHPDWARSLRDQCADAGVAFMFKQWGEWVDLQNAGGHSWWRVQEGSSTGRVGGGPLDGNAYHTAYPWNDGHCPGPCMLRVGKKAAGRLLDGVEYSEFPKLDSRA